MQFHTLLLYDYTAFSFRWYDITEQMNRDLITAVSKVCIVYSVHTVKCTFSSSLSLLLPTIFHEGLS